MPGKNHSFVRGSFSIPLLVSAFVERNINNININAAAYCI